jgi:hypothetical protein
MSMPDELKECNILKLILIVRFACATLDVEHPMSLPSNLGSCCGRDSVIISSLNVLESHPSLNIHCFFRGPRFEAKFAVLFRTLRKVYRDNRHSILIDDALE